MNFDNSITSIPSTFGKLTGYTYKPSLKNYDYNVPYIIPLNSEGLGTKMATITTASGKLVANKDLVKQVATNGYQGLHTSTAIDTDLSTVGFGVKYDPALPA